MKKVLLTLLEMNNTKLALLVALMALLIAWRALGNV